MVRCTHARKECHEANWNVRARAARELGGSSWANVGSMTVLDDNGRYTKSLTLSDTYDYRASFAAPNNEGLEDATSPVVRVTVYSSGGECGQTKSITDGHGSMYTC